MCFILLGLPLFPLTGTLNGPVTGSVGTDTIIPRAFAQGAQEDGGPAPSAFLPAESFEFASVLEGTRVTHDFVIQNKGAAQLNIFRVKTG
jgi:hypothetical protein